MELMFGTTSPYNKGEEDSLFDSNCITPGTEFMESVSRHLKWFIRKKIKPKNILQFLNFGFE
jgi:5'-3' exonuclease